MKNDKLLLALRCKNEGRPPLWVMRQAGRYLPEYRKLREKHAFLEMCHRPELAAEVTLLPLKTLDFDAAILFSDILVIAEALGVGLRFEESKGPIIERPLSTAKDVAALSIPNIDEKLRYVSEAIKLVLPQLQVPLIGFCGAPFTVASYMIEGGSSRDMKKTKQWLLRDPKSFHQLLDVITTCSIAYLRMQMASGVAAVQIFDSWANVLGHAQFREFSLAYLEKLVKVVKGSGVPVILFCKGSSVWASQLAEISPSGISVDWQADLSHVRKVVPRSIALQGNLDPDILYAGNDKIRAETKRLLQSMKGDAGYVFNLGHGIHPDTPVEAVKTLIEIVRN